MWFYAHTSIHGYRTIATLFVSCCHLSTTFILVFMQRMRTVLTVPRCLSRATMAGGAGDSHAAAEASCEHWRSLAL